MARKARADVAMDSGGNYVRNLGWKGEPGAYKQHRFYLGTNRAEAVVRAARLAQVWAAVETRWQREPETPRPVWDEVTLQIGQAVSRGEPVCRLDLPGMLPIASDELPDHIKANDDGEAADLVAWARGLQDDFPMIRIVLDDDQIQGEGEEQWRRGGEEFIERGNRMLRKVKPRQTLHMALDAFGEHLRQRYSDGAGKLTLTGQVAVKDLTRLKDHIADMPLVDLDLAAIDRWVDYWSKRPLTKRQKPAAVRTCKNTIKRIRMFVRWLHREKAFEWRKPNDYEVMPVKVKMSAAELAKKVNGVQTYSDEELVKLWKHGKPKERFYMLLALNCGFGIAEIATLQTEEIHFHTKHRKYGEVGNYIMRVRLKTGVYGEWLLWDETFEAVKWYLGVRPPSQQTALVLTEKGEPVADQTSGGNRAQCIPNTWDRLIDRVRKLEDKHFRRLSFGKLRKTAINAIREIANGEVAGVFAAHGNPVPSDGLIDLYSNRDFRKVFEACRKWRERLSPMFLAVPEPFVRSKRRHQKPEDLLAKRARIVTLRAEGKTLAEIGAIVGLSVNAVSNHLRQHRVAAQPPGEGGMAQVPHTG
jgi:hypothetical protein